MRTLGGLAVHRIMAIGAERLPVVDVESVLGMRSPGQDVVSAKLAVLAGHEATGLAGVFVSVKDTAPPLLNLCLLVARSACGCVAAIPSGIVLAPDLIALASVCCVRPGHERFAASPRTKATRVSALANHARRYRKGLVTGFTDESNHAQIIPIGPLFRGGGIRLGGRVGWHGDGGFLRDRAVLRAGVGEALAGGSRAW